MTYLIATILLNTLLFAIFKLFHRFRIDGLQAIVVNYIVCVITGSITSGEFPIGKNSISEPWLPWSVAMGAMFIALFNLIAWRTREDGMTTTTTANKLSLVIPVIASVWLYNEQLSIWKIAGILLAFPAVYLATRVASDDARPRSILFPVILFSGSGILDTLVKYTEDRFLQSRAAQSAYTIHLFATAALVGLIILIIRQMRGQFTLDTKSILAGIVLGIPNYFSIFFLIRLLHSDFLQSSAAIPVNNIGIVLCSALTAIFIFKEKPGWKGILGLILSITAILLIAISDLYG